jgi:PAS domain S-box-containing protein
VTPELSELHAAPEIKNVAMLIHSLAATEAALAAALPDEVDAVISPITATPFLLQRAQVALHLSERRYRHLLSRMAAIVFELKPDGTILYVNDAVQQATGYPAQELIGKNWWRTFFPGDEYRQVTALHIRLRQGDVSNLELDLTTSTGSRITMELNTANRYAVDGTLQQFLGLGVDITERKIANTQVQFQANLLNTIDQSVIATDLEDKVIYWNRFAEVLYGCSPTEAIGQFVSELVTSLKTPDQSTEMIARIKNGESWTGEFDVRRRDGTVFPVVVISSPIYDANGSLVGMIHVSADISERRRAEEALKESEKAEREQRELAEALLDSAATLTSVLDPTLVMNRILENVGRVITHESANIMLIDGVYGLLARLPGRPRPSGQDALSVG